MRKDEWLYGLVVLMVSLSWLISGVENPESLETSTILTNETCIVVDASDFMDYLPKNHRITDAGELGVPWLFNNIGLVMGTRSNYVKKISIPEAGTYHLFVRSHGEEESQFRVAVNDRVIDSNLGDDPLSWERAGTFELEAGTADVRIMRIENSPVLDVLLFTKRETFPEEELKPLQLHPDVSLLQTFDIPEPHAVKFGDLDGDNRTDFMVLSPDYSAVGFSHEGEQLWSWKAPEEYASERASFEAPGLIWDLDRDGAAEAIHWRQSGGREWLVAADGTSGEVKFRAPWPTRPLPHAYNNFRLAVGNLDGGYPDEVIVLTDMGGQINVTAYDNELNRLWQHEEMKKKDHLGHYVYPVDLNGDRKDEVVVGSLVLDHSGNEIWNRFDLFYDHHDHVDSYRFDDIDQDDDTEIVTAHSEFGVVAFEGMTGEMMWQDAAEHTQQIETGAFLEGVKGPQVVVGARTYGNRSAGEPYLWARIHWYDPEGELVHTWPRKPINGNPVFVKGDWDGDGSQDLFWYKFRLNEQGEGDLYFGESVYHMFDFIGNRAEEVITLDRGKLRIYGSREAKEEELPNREKNAEYLKNEVANHTHY